MKKDPEGYKKLLVYIKSDELHWEVLKLAEEIKRVERGKKGEGEIEQDKGKKKGERESKPYYSPYTLYAPFDKILLELADQLGRAGRSPMSNIVEGWKRNTTSEYFEFLGYSIASTEEIKKDCADIIRRKYPKLKGVTGVKGMNFEEVDKLPFYPLNPLLPFVVQIYLRSKELTMLLYKLQLSLEKKMGDEGTLPTKVKFKNRKEQENEAERWLKGELERLKGSKGNNGGNGKENHE